VPRSDVVAVWPRERETVDRMQRSTQPHLFSFTAFASKKYCFVNRSWIWC